MKTKQQLLKLFAQSLKNRANQGETTINPLLLRYLSRKDLIHIIKDLNNRNIPKEINLIELENEDLLTLIGNDLAIIAYMTVKWCKEEMKEKTNRTEIPHVPARTSPQKTPTTPKKEEVKPMAIKKPQKQA